jgi:hypothetical protein
MRDTWRKLVFIGETPDEDTRDTLGAIVDHWQMAGQAGAALEIERGDGVPPDVWYVNRVVYAEGGLTYILEKGAGLRPITRDAVAKKVREMVVEAADKRLTPQAQENRLADFVCGLMKGRVFQGE